MVEWVFLVDGVIFWWIVDCELEHQMLENIKNPKNKNTVGTCCSITTYKSTRWWRTAIENRKGIQNVNNKTPGKLWLYKLPIHTKHTPQGMIIMHWGKINHQNHAQNKDPPPDSDQTYIFVVDYSQNMDISFGALQPVILFITLLSAYTNLVLSNLNISTKVTMNSKITCSAISTEKVLQVKEATTFHLK